MPDYRTATEAANSDPSSIDTEQLIARTDREFTDLLTLADQRTVWLKDRIGQYESEIQALDGLRRRLNGPALAIKAY